MRNERQSGRRGLRRRFFPDCWAWKFSQRRRTPLRVRRSPSTNHCFSTLTSRISLALVADRCNSLSPQSLSKLFDAWRCGRGVRLHGWRIIRNRQAGWARSARKPFRASAGRADRARNPFAMWLATLALFAQLLAPLGHSTATPGPGEVADELKAAFGDAVVLCIQDGNSSQEPIDRSGHCGDGCPLCQFHSGAHALLLPLLAALPMRIEAGPQTFGLAPVQGWLKTNRTAFAQPRAPPFEV